MSFYVLTAQVVGSGQSDASVVNLLIHVALLFTRDAVKSRFNAARLCSEIDRCLTGSRLFAALADLMVYN